MLKLMDLELKRNKLRTYQIAAMATFLLVLGFTYLFAYVPRFNPEDADLLIFAGYDNVLALSVLICMAIFCVLSSVMYARFIIDEYAGKRATLLFSYPVSRRKVLFSKILIVFIFNFLAIVICSVIALGIFSLTEQFSPMVDDTLTMATILSALRSIVVMAIIAPSLGIVATGIGFVSKSVPAAIISAVVMVSLVGNFMSSALQTPVFSLVLLGISVAAAMLSCIILAGKVNSMEVE